MSRTFDDYAPDSLESNPDILRAEMSVLDTPVSVSYSFQAYAAIKSVEAQCQTDLKSFCSQQVLEQQERVIDDNLMSRRLTEQRKSEGVAFVDAIQTLYRPDSMKRELKKSTTPSAVEVAPALPAVTTTTIPIAKGSGGNGMKLSPGPIVKKLDDAEASSAPRGPMGGRGGRGAGRGNFGPGRGGGRGNFGRGGGSAAAEVGLAALEITDAAEATKEAAIDSAAAKQLNPAANSKAGSAGSDGNAPAGFGGRNAMQPGGRGMGRMQGGGRGGRGGQVPVNQQQPQQTDAGAGGFMDTIKSIFVPGVTKTSQPPSATKTILSAPSAPVAPSKSALPPKTTAAIQSTSTLAADSPRVVPSHMHDHTAMLKQQASFPAAAAVAPQLPVMVAKDSPSVVTADADVAIRPASEQGGPRLRVGHKKPNGGGATVAGSRKLKFRPRSHSHNGHRWSHSDSDSDSDSDGEDREYSREVDCDHEPCGPPPELIDSFYTGELGFGYSADQCMYQKFDQLSQPCSEAIDNLHQVREQFWESQSESAHCHGGRIVMFFLGALLLIVGVKKWMRRGQVHKVRTFMNAIRSNEALRATLESQGVIVPDPPKALCGGKLRKIGCRFGIFIALMVSFFVAVDVSGHIVRHLDEQAMEQEQEGPSMIAAIAIILGVWSVILCVSLLTYKVAKSVYQCVTRSQGVNVEPSAPIGYSALNQEDFGTEMTTRTTQMQLPNGTTVAVSVSAAPVTPVRVI